VLFNKANNLLNQPSWHKFLFNNFMLNDLTSVSLLHNPFLVFIIIKRNLNKFSPSDLSAPLFPRLSSSTALMRTIFCQGQTHFHGIDVQFNKANNHLNQLSWHKFPFNNFMLNDLTSVHLFYTIHSLFSL
jgi:hypothetical protein